MSRQDNEQSTFSQKLSEFLSPEAKKRFARYFFAFLALTGGLGIVSAQETEDPNGSGEAPTTQVYDSQEEFNSIAEGTRVQVTIVDGNFSVRTVPSTSNNAPLGTLRGLEGTVLEGVVVDGEDGNTWVELFFEGTNLEGVFTDPSGTPINTVNIALLFGKVDVQPLPEPTSEAAPEPNSDGTEPAPATENPNETEPAATEWATPTPDVITPQMQATEENFDSLYESLYHGVTETPAHIVQEEWIGDTVIGERVALSGISPIRVLQTDKSIEAFGMMMWNDAPNSTMELAFSTGREALSAQDAWVLEMYNVLYYSIPEEQRPPFEEFMRNFRPGKYTGSIYARYFNRETGEWETGNTNIDLGAATVTLVFEGVWDEDWGENESLRARETTSQGFRTSRQYVSGAVVDEQGNLTIRLFFTEDGLADALSAEDSIKDYPEYSFAGVDMAVHYLMQVGLLLPLADSANTDNGFVDETDFWDVIEDGYDGTDDYVEAYQEGVLPALIVSAIGIGTHPNSGEPISRWLEPQHHPFQMIQAST
ncbi:hypothetical protein LRY65_03585 [Candidatus Woesebacteria bacterium]|nr:hypothetical protein [Candidatus Woesebacteria bacterium]MCD8506974.1 hypothetical protein [Candidatus Woesebacteria bacterium]MCD8527265.1 hypothetical protein [Candidatus Woesebacteria bacterium]MCD8546631.1 hypothetical protein [Candidatus Woesebacteria bacterium]